MTSTSGMETSTGVIFFIGSTHDEDAQIAQKVYGGSGSNGHGLGRHI